MTLEGFIAWVSSLGRAVILAEGTRDPLPGHEPVMTALATHLARRLPHAVFRSGNAPGADHAFARGIEAVDPSRLELVTPYRGHRGRAAQEVVRRWSLEDVPPAAHAAIARHAAAASPRRREAFERFSQGRLPRAAAMKVGYLMRDTLKVAGTAEVGLAPATVGLFYLNPARPDQGGTAHTVRVCRHLGVPVFTQEKWLGWALPTECPAG